MIKNKIFFFTILIFLTQCGYQTIYSNKNLDFSVTEIKILNDQNIGRQIKNRLGLRSSKNTSDNFSLIIDSKFGFRTIFITPEIKKIISKNFIELMSSSPGFIYRMILETLVICNIALEMYQVKDCQNLLLQVSDSQLLRVF